MRVVKSRLTIKCYHAEDYVKKRVGISSQGVDHLQRDAYSQVSVKIPKEGAFLIADLSQRGIYSQVSVKNSKRRRRSKSKRHILTGKRKNSKRRRISKLKSRTSSKSRLLTGKRRNSQRRRISHRRSKSKMLESYFPAEIKNDETFLSCITLFPFYETTLGLMECDLSNQSPHPCNRSILSMPELPAYINFEWYLGLEPDVDIRDRKRKNPYARSEGPHISQRPFKRSCMMNTEKHTDLVERYNNTFDVNMCKDNNEKIFEGIFKYVPLYHQNMN